MNSETKLWCLDRFIDSLVLTALENLHNDKKDTWDNVVLNLTKYFASPYMVERYTEMIHKLKQNLGDSITYYGNDVYILAHATFPHLNSADKDNVEIQCRDDYCWKMKVWHQLGQQRNATGTRPYRVDYRKLNWSDAIKVSTNVYARYSRHSIFIVTTAIMVNRCGTFSAKTLFSTKQGN